MKYLILLIIISIILFYLNNQKSKQHFSKVNILTVDYLSDLEFLEHMIPHHQVAIDMSLLLQPITKKSFNERNM